MKKITMQLMPFMFMLIVVFLVSTTAFGGKPPWAGGPGGPKDQPPVYAPEPITISLIGMGASAVAGYYLGKKKNRHK
jgi:hypothetical protein